MKIIKFVRNGLPVFGAVEAEGEIRVGQGSPFTGDFEPGQERLALSELTLLPPTVDHPRIFGVGFNYRSHILETGRPLPEIPPIFMKPDTALAAHEQPVIYPRQAKVVHYETELVAVIGRRARSVRREDALSHVLGYACGNDVSERTFQRREMAMGLMTVGKAFDTFAPVGPWIDTTLDPASARLRGLLNGSVVQEGDTSDLLFGVDALVEYLSSFITLLPGDLIMTGTPGGVGPVQPGDVFEVEIEGIGTLRNRFVTEADQ